MRLSQYQDDTTSLLRDWAFQFTTQRRLTRWINTGRRQLAKATGCLRTLVPGTAPYGAIANPGTMLPGSFAPGVAPDQGFYAQQGTERYAYAYGNPFVRANNAGYLEINDVFTVAVSWGAARPALRWLPFDEMQAYCRAYSAVVSSYPAVWSTLGSGSAGAVWLWPPPSQQLEMEWDVTCLPADLNSDDDYDAIPDSLASSIKYYAAGMAMLGTFRYGQADAMFQLYLQHFAGDMTATEGGKVASYYYTSVATS